MNVCERASVRPSSCVLRENSDLVDHLWLPATFLFYKANTAVRGEPLCTVGTESMCAEARETDGISGSIYVRHGEFKGISGLRLHHQAVLLVEGRGLVARVQLSVCLFAVSRSG